MSDFEIKLALEYISITRLEYYLQEVKAGNIQGFIEAISEEIIKRKEAYNQTLGSLGSLPKL